MGKFLRFIEDEKYLENERSNVYTFNIPFDRFIRNDTLKIFYREKIYKYSTYDLRYYQYYREHITPLLSSIENGIVTSVPNSINLHPKTYFDENGKLIYPNPVTRYMDEIGFDYQCKNDTSNKK